MSEHNTLTCQMTDDCKAPVTHIDNKGYIYCTQHGIDRRDVRPCRKLLKREIAALERGNAINWRPEPLPKRALHKNP